ncbi:MAG: FHA domain-containing protein [Actinobacteria bacterium]|nr:FHA domain-containing protein [Actinomycetota bacterium]
MTYMSADESPCDICGESLPPGAFFCGECGASVPERPVLVPVPPRQENLPEPTVVVDITDLVSLVVPAKTEPEPEPEPEPLLAAIPTSTEPERTAEARYGLVFSTGERAQITGRALIGRKPSPEAGDGWDHLIVVNDASRTVSKSHLALEVTADGLVVTDLESANGTVVSVPGVAAERLIPHERVILPRGASVGMGDQSFIID